MKYNVEMTPDKTQLQVFSPPNFLQYYKSTNYLKISGIPLSFTDTAEHVGIICSTTSVYNPHVLQRIVAHKCALGAVLSARLARRNRGNPAEKLYGLPVLFAETVFKNTRISYLFSWRVSTLPCSSSYMATFNLCNNMQTSRKHP